MKASFFLMTLFTISIAKAQYVDPADSQIHHFPDAQESFLGLNFGFSDPTGDYASNRGSDYDPGFALLGYNVNIFYFQPLVSNFGYTIMLNRSAHNFDAQKMSDVLQENYPYSLNGAGSLLPLSWKVTSGSFQTNSFLGGLMMNYPLQNGFLDLRLMLGYAISTYPKLTVTADDGKLKEIFVQNASVSGATAVDIGIGLRKNISNYFAISLNLDWYFTRPTFNQTVTSNLGPTTQDLYTMNMSMANVTVGIGYRIIR